MLLTSRAFKTIFYCGLLLAVSASHVIAAPQTIIVARHAEKAVGDGDVPLTSFGEKRARTLALMLKDAKVMSIYCSQTKRTRDTGKYLAERLRIKESVIQKGHIDELVKRLKSARSGSTALLIWHIDELPAIVKELGGQIEEYGDQEYDRLTVLTLLDGKVKNSLVLRYGAPSQESK